MTDRFDDLARTLADPTAVERRGLLGRAVAALGVGATVAVAGADRAGATPKPTLPICPPGLTLCGAVCRDLTGHNSHCGACDNACADDAVCRNGRCVTVACICNPTCPAGQTWCEGACRDLQSDVGNCGACGSTCPPVANGIAACSNGTCGSVCAPGFADCDGNPATGCETAILRDAANCGACGHTCPAGQVCSNGQCVCVSPSASQTCAQQGKNCGTTVDSCGRSVNCGGCPAPQVCGAGGPGICGFAS